MTAQKYANFPEREPKVVIGLHINANTTKILGKLSIGTFEMSVGQQEKIQASAECARQAMNALAREHSLTVTAEPNRDYPCALVGQNATVRYQVWITSPFESGQSAHLVWVKFSELDGEGKVGIAFKLATSYATDDIANLLRNALKNAVVLPAGEPFTLKGNPPPRFTKKVPAVAAAPADSAAQPAETPPTAG